MTTFLAVSLLVIAALSLAGVVRLMVKGGTGFECVLGFVFVLIELASAFHLWGVLL